MTAAAGGFGYNGLIMPSPHTKPGAARRARRAPHASRKGQSGRGAPKACPVRLAAARAYLDFLNGGPPAEESPPHIHASADRRLFAQLLRGMVRHKRLLEAELARLTERPPARQHPALTTIALLGLYQLRFLERVPPHAAVYETVALARALGQGQAGGWVNAILRRAQREQAESAAWLAAQSVAVRTSHPDWMARRWHTQYGGKETERICEANNLGGGATLRVEQGRISPGELMRALADEEISARPHPLLPGALQVEQAGALLRSHSFREGLCYVQDIASQLLLAWMAPLFKGRVLDACAAPGGKLTWLAGLRRARLSVLGADIAPGGCAWCGRTSPACACHPRPCCGRTPPGFPLPTAPWTAFCWTCPARPRA